MLHDTYFWTKLLIFLKINSDTQLNNLGLYKHYVKSLGCLYSQYMSFLVCVSSVTQCSSYLLEWFRNNL